MNQPTDFDEEGQGLTRYALEEMDCRERTEFEAQFLDSEAIQDEIAATREFADFLRFSLDEEWKAELKPELASPFSLIEGSEEDGKVLLVDFKRGSSKVHEPDRQVAARTERSGGKKQRPGKKQALLSMAAVLTALGVVGAMFSLTGGNSSSGANYTWADQVEPDASSVVVPDQKVPVYTPSLLLVEELTEPLESLELAGITAQTLDSSYIGGGFKVNASFQPNQAAPAPRVDSYLPSNQPAADRLWQEEIILASEDVFSLAGKESEFSMDLVFPAGFDDPVPQDRNLSDDYHAIVEALETLVSDLNRNENDFDLQSVKQQLEELLKQHSDF